MNKVKVELESNNNLVHIKLEDNIKTNLMICGAGNRLSYLMFSSITVFVLTLFNSTKRVIKRFCMFKPRKQGKAINQNVGNHLHIYKMSRTRKP